MTPPSDRKHAPPRIPLNTFAIAFGIAGLATLWSTVTVDLGGPVSVPVVLWAAAGVAWVWLIIAHLRRGARSDETLMSQLRHPAQGPIAAVVPVLGMLLGSELYLVWPLGGAVLTVVSLVVAAAFAGWILAYWHRGKINQEAFHGAYLFPTVAAAFIASIATSRLDLPGIAFGAFGVGMFFWIVIGTVLLSRLAFFPPLPDALTPTLAITIAPPAIGGTAWFAMNGVHADAVSTAFLGVLIVTLLFQLFMIGTYLRLPFSLGHWSFTFPVASAASYGIQWMRLTAFPGWQFVALAAAAVSTALTLTIAVRSLLLVTRVRRGIRRAEQTLRRADDAVARRMPLSKPSAPTHSQGSPS
ncbi:transporter [Herbiconiux sp. P16]|uniref:SLAC1 family transporter n=1 Tax=Herbiconiux wuyangfengii TaxID=3342794 RepID=UPI0035B77F0A